MHHVEIEARKMFDLYYDYCEKGCLEILQQFLESTYRLNERLIKATHKNQSFFDIDEFLVIKLLRNFVVHEGELDGQVWCLKPSFSNKLKMDLSKVCLIKKTVIHKAINNEAVLSNEVKELNKTAKIRSLLISIDHYYNFEPIIYNFTVRAYEKLLELDINVKGEGFNNLSVAYNKETYYGFSHYVKTDDVILEDYNISTLTPFLMPFDDFIASVRPLEDIPEEVSTKEDSVEKLKQALEVLPVKAEQWHGYSNDEYVTMHKTISKIIRNDNSLLEYALLMFSLIKIIPNMGIALVTDKSGKGTLTSINISKQKQACEVAGMDIPTEFFTPSSSELLCVGYNDEWFYPVLLSKKDFGFVSVGSCKNLNLNNKKRVVKNQASAIKNKAKNKRKTSTKARRKSRK